MSETGVDFGVLLDSQRARIEKDAENAEATHAEQLKEAEASLAKRIASALFFLETTTKESWNVNYYIKSLEAGFIEKAIDTLVARGYFVKNWRYSIFPANDPKITFCLEIFRLGSRPPGTEVCAMFHPAACGLL